MSADTSSQGATRRGVLKTGAIGLGSVAGAFGLAGAGTAEAAGALVLPAADIGGSMDWFLSIPGNPGIPGDSTDDEHANWIDLESVQWGASAPASTGSTATAKATVSAVSLTAQFGTASPRLFAAAMSGRRFTSAVVEGIRVADSTRTKVIELRMQDVVITGYSTSTGGDWPYDSFNVVFQRLTYTFWPQSADGTVGTPISATWDAKSGTATST